MFDPVRRISARAQFAAVNGDVKMYKNGQNEIVVARRLTLKQNMRNSTVL